MVKDVSSRRKFARGPDHVTASRLCYDDKTVTLDANKSRDRNKYNSFWILNVAHFYQIFTLSKSSIIISATCIWISARSSAISSDFPTLDLSSLLPGGYNDSFLGDKAARAWSWSLSTLYCLLQSHYCCVMFRLYLKSAIKHLWCFCVISHCMSPVSRHTEFNWYERTTIKSLALVRKFL